jgi:hypothetical protein
MLCLKLRLLIKVKQLQIYESLNRNPQQFTVNLQADNMSSFMDIKDPWKRDATIKDYLATMKRIQKRNEEEKTSGLYRQRELEQHFAPVVQSQDKMSKEITEGLKPIKQEVATLRENLETVHAETRKRHRADEYGPLATEFRARYASRDPNVDTTFGITYLRDGRTVIANTPVTISGDDIIIYDEVYDGTPGLWALLTETQEDKLGKGKWTQDDVDNYAAILGVTNVLHEDYDSENPNPRASKSWKWRKILKPIWQQLKREESSGSGLLLPQHPVPGCRVYLNKNGHCCMVQTTRSGKGLHLSPHPPIGGIFGNGLYLKAGSTLYDGHGLLLGPNSPFKSIPILGLLL